MKIKHFLLLYFLISKIQIRCFRIPEFRYKVQTLNTKRYSHKGIWENETLTDNHNYKSSKSL